MRSRRPYSSEELRPLISPESVAVVGLSGARDAAGTWILRNLVENGFTGQIYGVNPKYASLHDTPCYPTIEALPEAVDCALIAVAPRDAEEAIEQSARKGVRSALIFSSGFAETGDREDVERELRIAHVAADAKMPVSGPNLLGQMNFVDQKFLTIYADAGVLPREPGNLAVISQSGGLGFSLAHRRANGLRVSYLLTCGNSCDVDVVDYLNFAIESDATTAIVLLLEGVADGRALVEMGHKAMRAGKAIIAHKLGRSNAGSRAALSHTGSVAGSSRVYSAAFREAGIVEAAYEDLLDVAQMFVNDWRPSTSGVGVLSTSGGAAVLAADAAAKYGVVLPAPATETSEQLRAEVPGFGVVGNPSDLTSATIRNPSLFGRAVLAFASDPNFAAIVVPVFVSYGMTTSQRPAMVVETAARSSKPICAVWMSSWLGGPGVEILEASRDLSVFRSLDDCFAALSRWTKWHEGAADTSRWMQVVTTSGELGGPLLDDFVKTRSGGERIMLTEVQSTRLLESAGIRFAAGEVATSAAEATEIANKLGCPVVMKVVSPEIPHKAKVGCVAVGVMAESIESEFDRLMKAAASVSGATVHGVLVQELIRPGREMFIGARRDPQFGPIVACGLGGVDIEAINEVSVALAPVSRRTVYEMIVSLSHGPEAGGSQSDDGWSEMDAFIDLVVDVASLFAADNRIAEIDVNPVIVRPNVAPVAVDALVVCNE